MELIIEIKKSEVYDEVAKLTSYVGAKTIGDTGFAYDRVFATDDDRELLERFWRESTNYITDECKRFMKQVSSPATSQEINMNEIYSMTLELPENFDLLLKDSIESSLRSYCINMITSKWFAVTNKADAEYYMAAAERNGMTAKNELYHRTKPIRVTIN